MNSRTVTIWIEDVIIPTYHTGKPEKNPIFLEKRVYQGSSGTVYPHPVIEKVEDEKKDKTYKVYYLENDYLKIMILPELGGRVQMAWDKIRERHFVYYNQVIKPALVGLTGPWISGGIEFNWPQHHRPSTFEAVDVCITENADGSKTIWTNEVERMFRTKAQTGFTLHPDKAYLEIEGKLYNRTSVPQTFLWWANPAVKVNEHYQSVFPPDVHAVFDHGKRDVSSFPIATGTYYKVDYSPGTDISRYKNIPVPTSYMAIRSDYDFIGGYEHDTEAGMLHVADHHISPGKKQWTWGNADFGKAWDRNLTDEDGPYIEIMTGVFTDNQPDFSWIAPYEQKTFKQYFMPYAKVGLVKNATKEAVINLTDEKGFIDIKVYVTAEYPAATIVLKAADETLFIQTCDLSPETPFVHQISSTGSSELTLIVADNSGTTLVEWTLKEQEEKSIPDAASVAEDPENIEENESLYLNGLHIEQYRHATYQPDDYYKEALARDPGDTHSNKALGLWHLKKGLFKEASAFFERSVGRLTERNPNPYDGEYLYNLGLSLFYQHKLDGAYNAFFKASWNAAWQHSALLFVARIDLHRKEWQKALEHIRQSIVFQNHSHTALHIHAITLRKTGAKEASLSVIDKALEIDPFNYGCLFERYLLIPNETHLKNLRNLIRGNGHTLFEYVWDYAHAGCFDEAIALMQAVQNDAIIQNPMYHYYLGWLHQQKGDAEKALECYKQAAKCAPDYCFPNRIEDIAVFDDAISTNPADGYAPYYLGNLWYDKRLHEQAIACWERSVGINPKFPTAWRNLSLALFNKRKQVTDAVHALEKAFDLDKNDARVLMELDQLHKITGKSPESRLLLIEKHPNLVNDRDDIYLEKTSLYNLLGKYDTTKKLLQNRQFHPWEGGEGKVVGQYLFSQLELAKKALQLQKYEEAILLLKEALVYPHNLGEGKLPGTPENDIFYLIGLAYELKGANTEAKENYIQAASGEQEPHQAIFYNDPQPDKLLYKGLAHIKLNEVDKAFCVFNQMIDFGEKHINDTIRIDYFAVSLPDLQVFDQDLSRRNNIHCRYMIGLGYLGLKEWEKAESNFRTVLEADLNHQGATAHLSMISFLQNSRTNTMNELA